MSKWRELLGIDIRSLALFRVGLGFMLLYDLVTRLKDLTAHYTDYGILPRELLIEKLLDPWSVSLHLISGNGEIQFALFILAIIFATLLLVGYRTRLATICSWFLLLSLQSRNPLILQGGDDVLRLLLFWSLFLPLGAYASVDQYLSKNRFPTMVVSVGSVAILLQVAFIYWFAALLKTDSSWRTEGTAVWYALQISEFSTPVGKFLLNYPALLKALTFFTFYLEALAPFLAFSPFFTAPLRAFTAFLFILFHFCLYLSMELGHFSFVCMLAWTLFIPGRVWDYFNKMKTVEIGKASLLSNCLAGFFIAYIFLWNLSHLGFSPLFDENIGFISRVDQHWNMFAPYPLRTDGWVEIVAKLKNGEEVDLLQIQNKSDRWRSFMLNLVYDEKSDLYLLNYARYLTRLWNERHSGDTQLATFDIYYLLVPNQFGKAPPPPEKIHIWQHFSD